MTLNIDGPQAADQLRSLHTWLTDVDELRGRVGCKERPPEQGTLGPLLEALTVALAPGAAATALATTVIAWLRTRRAEIRIKVTLPDRRSLELSARNVAGLDAAALRQQVADAAVLLGAQDQQGDATLEIVRPEGREDR
ncbi:effector-associated constant component EACC1 [Streptomyces sp. NPDC004262]